MTRKRLLLILALTATLIAQVHSKKDEGSGDAETESHATLEVPSPVLQEDVSTPHTHLYLEVLTPQTVPLLEEEIAVKSYPQVVSPKTSTIQSKVNSTQKQNVTQKQNLTQTTGSPHQPRLRFDVKFNSTTEAPHTSPEPDEESDGSSDNHIFIIIVVSLLLTLVLTAMVVGAWLLINRKSRREKEAVLKEDPYLDGEGSEKVPMPMFEDDVPSVMELEMEDLEKWMIKGDGGISLDSKQKQQFS